MSDEQINEGDIYVLVVDDGELFLDAVTDILDMDGITVTGAEDGEMGIELFRKTPAKYQLVIVDAKLPDMPGSQVLETIKQIDPEVPVIVSSGHTMQTVINEYGFDSETFDGYLSKPFGAMALLEIVQKTIRRPTAASQVE